jgi:excisionase family DNA binding protein
METEIIYKLTHKDFEQVLDRKLESLSKKSMLARFQDRLVSVDTVAEIHGIHRDTVVKYANAKLLPHQKKGKLYKFSLAEVLEVNFNELKKQV